MDKQITVQELIRKIAVEIEGATPSRTQVMADLKMRRYKIRPIDGDFFSMPVGDEVVFLTFLWKISKIEEVVDIAFKTLSDSDINTLFNYLARLGGKIGYQFDPEAEHYLFSDNKNWKLQLEIFRDHLQELTIN